MQMKRLFAKRSKSAASPEDTRRASRDQAKEQSLVENFTSQDFDILRLRKSPQYLLVILQGKMTVSAKLPQQLHRTIAKSWLAKFPRASSYIVSAAVSRRSIALGGLEDEHLGRASGADTARSAQLHVRVLLSFQQPMLRTFTKSITTFQLHGLHFT